MVDLAITVAIDNGYSRETVRLIKLRNLKQGYTDFDVEMIIRNAISKAGDLE